MYGSTVKFSSMFLPPSSKGLWKVMFSVCSPWAGGGGYPSARFFPRFFWGISQSWLGPVLAGGGGVPQDRLPPGQDWVSPRQITLRALCLGQFLAGRLSCLVIILIRFKTRILILVTKDNCLALCRSGKTLYQLLSI